MSAITTRLATQQDIIAVALLFDAYRQFYKQKSDLYLATTFIQERLDRKESVILIAEDKNEILGFCQLYPTYCSVEARPIYSLYDLFVTPEARKSGAGKAMLLAAEEHAARNKFARMDLTTARTNLPAQSLYESLGWIRDEIFYAYNKSVQE
jgi:ribosomal protein S18 acetylase RimI-like enzyme